MKFCVGSMQCPETGLLLKFLSGFHWDMISPDRKFSKLNGDSVGQEWWFVAHIWQRYYIFLTSLPAN